MKSLNHAHIVKIINCFVIKKSLQTFFIMEYLSGKKLTVGGELANYIKKGKPINEKDALEIFDQILRAIEYCHNSKIIHRDLKLENIMKVSENSNQIKIVDFGIAGLFAGLKSEITKAGSINYLSPEVISGKNLNASPAMDIWAMGCILYALLVGELPFDDPHNKEVKEDNKRWS